MQSYQLQFIEFIIQHHALSFGEFKLKSGRISPYFFNIGVFNTGEALAKLGRYYAAAIQHADLDFDILFGPAYKGISLVCSTALTLYQDYHHNVNYCFNRKEVKDHGEGGNLIGADLKGGRVLIIDDAITGGTAIRQSMELIKAAQAESVVGIVIALDRQERGTSNHSAIQEIEKNFHTQVISIISFDNIIEYISQETTGNAELLKKLQEYRQQYQPVSFG